ncbi:MAG: DUF2304 domain-containing protein [Acetatifactor sp.]|nr:DUF2304 domain-containing protein [Acetatifactor sp.]
MEPSVLLRIIMILTGVVLFVVTLSSLAKRRMTESFCLTWGLISVIIILAGILLRPTEWSSYISGTGMILVGLIGFCVVYGAYFMSTKVSELMRKNMELAMQVSLLGKENEEMKKMIQKLSEDMEQDKEK